MNERKNGQVFSTRKKDNKDPIVGLLKSIQYIIFFANGQITGEFEKFSTTRGIQLSSSDLYTRFFFIEIGYKKPRAQMARKLRNFRAEFQGTKETFPIESKKYTNFLDTLCENHQI